MIQILLKGQFCKYAASSAPLTCDHMLACCACEAAINAVTYIFTCYI